MSNSERALGRELWRRIALAYQTPRGDRTKEENGIAWWGLCGAVKWLWPENDQIGLAAVGEILYGYGGEGPFHGYFCVLSPENDQLRADFAWLQYYRLGGK